MLRRPSSEADEFVAARFPELLRTAYLLTGDPVVAEDLLQVALAEVATSWRRSELGPELTARRAMVRARTRWWRGRRRAPRDDEPDLLAALDRLPRRQRAALVLREHDHLADEELAAALECATPAAAHLAERARERLGEAQPGAALSELADTLAAADERARRLSVADRLDDVAHRVDVRRAWRRTELLASLFVATAVGVTVAAVIPSAQPRPAVPDTPPPGLTEPPPRVAGHQLASVLKVNDVGYVYFRSSQSFPGRPRLRVDVAAELRPQAVAWMSSPGTSGRILVTVDGDRVGGTPGGAFDSGVLLSAGRKHLVTVRATGHDPSMRLGLAVYEWPRP